jgi:glycerol-3-phosphate dehydrogenase
MAISRLQAPTDGNRSDLIVPQRQQTILGSITRPIEDADQAADTDGLAGTLIGGAAELLAAVGEAKVRAVWTAARPVFTDLGADGLPGEMRCYDHALDSTPAEGLVTVAGGNATLARVMAQTAADLVCRKLGVDRQCETAEGQLLPHSAWYV